MIGKVIRGARVGGLTRYLFGPGERNEHIGPHVVAGFRHPAALEPGARPDGSREVAALNGLLNLPLAALPPGTAPDKPVWHCVLRAAPEDPVLSDDDWAAIAHEVMDHVGLARYDDDAGVRWAAVRHADDHVHIVATLARQDGTKPRLQNDFYRVREACNRVEHRYGLRSTAPGDRTAAKRPTRGETEQARRQGRAEEPRMTLRRRVATVVATAEGERDFFARLRADGLLVRERFSHREPGQVTGYAVALPGHANREGRPVWFGGGRLAADLTLPKLRHRWANRSAATFRGPEHSLNDGAPVRNGTLGWNGAGRGSGTGGDAVEYAVSRLRSRSADEPEFADIAWAAADLLRAATWRVGDGPRGSIGRATEAYDRAARPPFARIPKATAAGSGLRAVARALAETSTDDDRVSRAVATLLNQIAMLTETVARLRTVQRGAAQAEAAHAATAHLRHAARAITTPVAEPYAPRQLGAEVQRTPKTHAAAVAALDFPAPPTGGPVRPPMEPDRPPGSRPSRVRGRGR